MAAKQCGRPVELKLTSVLFLEMEKGLRVVSGEMSLHKAFYSLGWALSWGVPEVLIILG